MKLFFIRIWLAFKYRKISFIKDLFMYTSLFWAFYCIAQEGCRIFMGEEYSKLGWMYISIIVAPSLILSIYKAYPCIKMSTEIERCGTNIKVEIGNLFECKGVVAIGFDDYFNTDISEKNKIISTTSLHGMFLKEIVGTNIGKFESLLFDQLKDIEGETNENRQKGRVVKYPIGTTVSYSTDDQGYLLTAISEMNDDLEAHSNMAMITSATFEMLSFARHFCNQKPLFLPLWGTGLSRTNMNPKHVLLTLLLAIYYETQKSKITDEITIVIHESMLNKISIDEIVSEWRKNGVS